MNCLWSMILEFARDRGTGARCLESISNFQAGRVRWLKSALSVGFLISGQMVRGETIARGLLYARRPCVSVKSLQTALLLGRAFATHSRIVRWLSADKVISSSRRLHNGIDSFASSLYPFQCKNSCGDKNNTYRVAPRSPRHLATSPFTLDQKIILHIMYYVTRTAVPSRWSFFTHFCRFESHYPTRLNVLTSLECSNFSNM